MKKLMVTTLLVASLGMTSGMALANAQNDDTNINAFGAEASQNGHNTYIQPTAGNTEKDAQVGPTLAVYTGGNH